MTRTGQLLTTISLLVPTAGSAVAFAEQQRLTFSQAVEAALRNSPEVASAGEGLEAAASKTAGSRALRYPKLRLEANLLRWDTPLYVDFGAPAMPGAMMPATDSRMVVRDRYTASALVSVAQPLSGLFVLSHMVAIDQSAERGAQADKGRTRLDVALRVAEAYLQVLQARALATVAEQAHSQIAAQLARSETLEKNGVASRVDVLRLVSSRDAATQNVVRARTNIEIAHGQLALALDQPPDTVIDVIDDFPENPLTLTVTPAQLNQAGQTDRPELVVASERTRQAEAGKTVALAEWLPNIMGVANYQHVEGQGPFQPRNAWYIGATLTWDVWDWGKTRSGVRQAESRAIQAQFAERTLRSQLVTEARRRFLETKAAFASLAPARSSLVAAEEAHRMQTVRYEKGVASTTDIIDAETDLTRARGAFEQARFDYYLAQARFARAAGALPVVAAKP